MGMKHYQDPQEQLPPKLLTEGARVDPEWLRRFLSNPALSETDTNRNGVRPYLKVHMPTFSLSENELRKLVRSSRRSRSSPCPIFRTGANAHSERDRHGAKFVLEHRGALPEVSCYRRSEA